MNVVLLCGYPFEENRFGVSEHIYQLSRALSKDKHAITCHIISMYDETKTLQVYPNVWLHTVAKRPYHYLWPSTAAATLKSIVLRIEPDIVHLHGASLPYVLTAINLSKEIPTLATIHGDVFEEISYKKGFMKIWEKVVSGTLMNYAIRNLETIIVCSKSMKERFNRFKKERVFVIPNGIDLHTYHKSNNKDEHKFSYVLYIGGLNKLKGVDVLIRSIHLIYEKIGPIPVYIAGSGAENKEIIALVHQEGLEQSVKFLGFVSGQKKVTLIQQAGLTVVPSRYESFGIVILESMACGVPVVASRIGGIPEIIQDRKSGLLFDVENVTQLANCITILVQTPELRNLYSQNGLRLVETFSWSVIANKTILLYHDCLNHFHKR